jgi:hypothetical protein
MGRETLVTDRIVPKSGGTLAIGSGPGSTFTPTGDLVMGASKGIAISSGGITGDQLAMWEVPGVDTRLNLTGRGTQLNVFGTPRFRRINFTYAHFSVANTTAFIDYPIDDFVSISPDDPWVVEDVFIRKITNFTGGGVTAVELTAGDAASAVGYVPAGQVDLFSGAPDVQGDAAAERGGYISTYGACKVQPDQAANNFRITLNSTTANLDQLTAGEASVYVRFYTLPQD